MNKGSDNSTVVFCTAKTLLRSRVVVWRLWIVEYRIELGQEQLICVENNFLFLKYRSPRSYPRYRVSRSHILPTEVTIFRKRTFKVTIFNCNLFTTLALLSVILRKWWSTEEVIIWHEVSWYHSALHWRKYHGQGSHLPAWSIGPQILIYPSL